MYSSSINNPSAYLELPILLSILFALLSVSLTLRYGELVGKAVKNENPLSMLMIYLRPAIFDKHRIYTRYRMYVSMMYFMV